MSRKPDGGSIQLRGVRHNNLKGFDLDLPLHRLIVVTGLSGSGKSSLAFDTLYAEGQRRYIETFSPYARQFFDRMDKPHVDRISGIPPAIAIEQRNSVRSTRSTVGTMTEICDHMKLLWPHVAQLHCRQCGQLVRKEPPQHIWEKLSAQLAAQSPELLITFRVPLSEKLPLAESLALIAKQGYQRLLINGGIVRLEEAEAILPGSPAGSNPPATITVVQDRIKLAPANRARFTEACEQAYHFGKGKLTIYELDLSGAHSVIRATQSFSSGLHCATCDIDYREPSPALFSFNHPLGACPMCKGFGRTIGIDYDLAIPDRSLTLAQGAVKPWRSGFSAECQTDMVKFCKLRKVPMDIPFNKMSAAHQDWVLSGDAGYGTDKDHEWPRAWYGVKGYFRWLESKAYKMHVRVLLSRYRSYTTCAACNGARLNPDALLYRLKANDADKKTAKLTLADFYALSVRGALIVTDSLFKTRNPKPAPRDPLSLALKQVHSRLQYLADVGLGYLTLNRTTRTLSGGETERVNLTTCLGTKLVNTLYVLDEPSVGLHPRDTARLVGLLEQLRDHGNTVVVVEHESSVMRAADQIVDLGPGHGATGGELVFQGNYREILKDKKSLTGQYLSGRKQVEIQARRSTRSDTKSLTMKNGEKLPTANWLRLTGANTHNLRNISVEIPLSRFVVITGVSGSGKSTLIREVLYPALSQKLGTTSDTAKASDRIDSAEKEKDDETQHATRSTVNLTGTEHLGRVLMVDQSSLGKTPRSNPAVYTGAFEYIREVFAQSEVAKQRGLNASAFSFNSGVGQCERCRGAGFEKIEMQFLSDIFIRCPDCNGRRYRPHILEVKVGSAPSWSICDALEASVDEAVTFFEQFGGSKPAQRGVAALKLLQDVGLGYLSLGQPINTLSGGESQRLKLAAHLAEAEDATHHAQQAPTLFIFDEPTTGLHFEDVRVLLQVFQRIVDAGHSVLVIEHNLDVIKCADWVIDLGPEAGMDGGQIVATGTPEDIAACPASHTGEFLVEVLRRKK